MTLKDTQPGEKVKIVKLNGEGATKRRIMDMGITKGIEIFVRKVAPLGDPIEVTVRGYELSVRKADAQLIEVEKKHARLIPHHGISCHLDLLCALAHDLACGKDRSPCGAVHWSEGTK